MDDSEVLALFAARDERAIGEIKRKYGAVCLRTAKNILRTDEDAEEVLSDVLLALWNAIPPAKPENLLAFSVRITRNLSCKKADALRASKRGGDNILLPMEELEEFLADGGETPEQALDAKLLRDAITDFLRRQRADDRKLFLRRYWYNQTQKELADAFGLSESGVRVRLKKLCESLKKELRERGFLV